MFTLQRGCLFIYYFTIAGDQYTWKLGLTVWELNVNHLASYNRIRIY